jgi:predicted O-methyltransferase YrrM
LERIFKVFASVLIIFLDKDGKMRIFVLMELEEYISTHIDAEPRELHDLYRRTHLRHLYPRMCSGHVQGRLLKMLAAMIRPSRILELGAFTGYSALCFAEGAPDAHIDTVEIDDEMADELNELFATATHGANITLHVGDALEVVPQLDGQWDLVFIDANKRLYLEYFNMVIDRVPAGGFIIADNTLWDDKVLDPEKLKDAQSKAIAAFNDAIAADTRVEKVIIPVRDGMTVMRKK